MISAKSANQKSAAEYESRWGIEALTTRAEVAISNRISNGEFRVNLIVDGCKPEVVRDLQDLLMGEGYAIILDRPFLTIMWD